MRTKRSATRTLAGGIAVALALLGRPAASEAQVEPAPRMDPAPPEPRIDFGATLGFAFGGSGDDGPGDDDDGSDPDYEEDAAFAMGASASAHIGLELGAFNILLLLHATAFAQAVGSSGRAYAGLGPALLLGWRPTAKDIRMSFEIGAGVDYGASSASDSEGERRTMTGAFPTVHHRAIFTLGDSPWHAGVHWMLAVPVQAPSLFALAATVVVGLRTF